MKHSDPEASSVQVTEHERLRGLLLTGRLHSVIDFILLSASPTELEARVLKFTSASSGKGPI